MKKELEGCHLLASERRTWPIGDFSPKAGRMLRWKPTDFNEFHRWVNIRSPSLCSATTDFSEVTWLARSFQSWRLVRAFRFPDHHG